jgi:dolichyl-diphosphooligosaccharide--protein glycosyltransferase/undecaprenyl-diphosphooligosaccharide--protein glycosyltransferase
MLDILPTVKIFSNINLDTGEKLTNPFFYRTSKVTQDKDRVDFGSGVVFDQKTGILAVGKQTVPVHQIITTGYDQDRHLAVNRQALHPDAPFTILILKDYDTVLIMDKEMYDSSYIQMFFLENYDHQYFEPVILTPWSKVYRAKS